jgi:hypothetical protein
VTAKIRMQYFVFQWHNSPQWAKASSLSGLQDHTQTHHTLSRTPLDEWSARRRDLYLTIHNTDKRQTSMPPAGFKPTIPASEQSQTHALDRTATGISMKMQCRNYKIWSQWSTFCDSCNLTKCWILNSVLWLVISVWGLT